MTPFARLLLLHGAIGLAAAAENAQTYSLELNVHYSSEADFSYMALRGSDAGLNWDEGVEMKKSEDGVYQTTLSVPATFSGVLEVKALLGDSVWQIGSNDFIDLTETAAASSVHLYPHFTTTEGTVETIRNVESKHLNNSRTVRVYLPPSYEENQEKTYTHVLLMHDGQNLFNPLTSAFGVAWMCQDTVNSLLYQGTMAKEIIIVGVDNAGADRIDEYTYSADPDYGGGNAEAYLDFLEQEVMPMILETYPRIDSSNMELDMLGSSLGGLCSCFAGFTRASVYRRVGCMSSSFWWNSEDFLNEIMARPSTAPGKVDFYLDSGSPDDDTTETISVRDQMEVLGATNGTDLWYYLDRGGSHDEQSWGARFWVPMTDLYGDPDLIVPV